ncbi:ABC transporter ATP-binding protein [Streptomyces sp. NBC_01324]|nr:ABC transporter ATP-binding protein [Streptomyces sp. NBC_01324]
MTTAPLPKAPEPGAGPPPLLTATDVPTAFHTRGPVQAVDGVSLSLSEGETLAIVGESGSGKSVLGRTLMGLITDGPGTTVSGTVLLGGRDVHALSPAGRRALWGTEAATVFQDPMTSLNPVKRTGAHLAESVRLHQGLSRAEARERAVELLRQVGIPEPARRARQYPHELSGGMRQRVVIAMALACGPGCSSRTNRPPRSTSPCRSRSWTCSRHWPATSGWRPSSSATTWPPSPAARTGSR